MLFQTWAGVTALQVYIWFNCLLQEKDYPAKFKEVTQFSSGKKRGELNSKLGEIALEIETAEGRRVELIQRRILEGGKGWW